MRVSVETTSGLERKLTVGVPAEEVDSAVDKKLAEAAQNVRLPGFRPGKVPMSVMKQRFGPGVRQEVLGDVINQSFQEAVMTESLRPAGQPSIEAKSVESGKDIEYVATFEIYPTVSLNEIKDFEVTRLSCEIGESDVNDIIEVFQKQQGQLVDMDRAAEEGDTLTIDFEGFKDGEAFEGGSGTDTALELGSGRMIPGFEDGLVGASAGDERTLELTFPEDYHSEELKGAAVEFKVVVKAVKALELAELNAELFASYGVEGDDVDAFRAEVQKNMERELKGAIDAHVKQQVMDAIIEAHPELEIPQSLISQETDALRGQMFQQFGGGISPDMDLKSILPDEMFSERAETRVRLGLLVSELVQDLGVRAEPNKVRELIEEIASTYQDPEEVINWYYEDNNQLMGIESRVLEDAVVDKLLEQASVTDEVTGYQDALQRTRAATQQ
ncbi:MAG: trigger factor [Luminiphilus sp.]|jgi:trigger factor